MKNFKRFLSAFMLVAMLLTTFATSALYAFADDATPALSVDGNVVSITEAETISYIRYAFGVYDNATALKNAADCVTLNASAVAARSDNGIFSVKLGATGVYTFWVKTADGATQLLYADITSIEPIITANGVIITVDNLYGAKDFFIAKGTHTTYREVKDNLVVQVTENKLNGATKYTYTVKDPGDYTVLVRYNDSEKENWIGYITLEVIEPEYNEYGLQLKVANLEGIKVIRAAYGEYSSASEIKKAEGARAFPARTIGSADPYTVQFRENGTATVAIVYNNGYYDIHTFEVKKRVPTVVQEGNTVTFSDLEELQNIRYAPGEYNTSAAIKNAEGSQTIKNNAIVDGVIRVTLAEAGVYSFCVQFKDESYNYYTITVEATEPDEPEIPDVPVVPEEPEIPEVATATGIDVSNAFSDNMIVQRDQTMSVWGNAEANSGYVFVEFSGETAIAKVAEDGTWKATFERTFGYNTKKQNITVKGADEEIVIKDVLIGDVYYIMGQSNVYYSMKNLKIALQELGETLTVDYKDTRNIRFLHVSSTDYANATGDLAQGTETVYNDITCDAKWQRPSQVGYGVASNREKVFSALGYLFAYNMSKSTDVPIGVIEADASGMPLTSFAPNHLSEKWGQEAYDEKTGTYHYKLGIVEQDELKTRFVYNQQIAPMTGFSLAGILWYQGESDYINNKEMLGSEAYTYPEMFTELMTYFRNTFGDGTYDFPVYMIELPPCYSNNGVNSFLDYALTRTEMGTIPQMLDNCYISSSSDLWFNETYWNNIHPPIKHLQAYRLTDVVLAAGYDLKVLNDVHGPVLNKVEYNGNSATLTFDYAGSGLAPAHASVLGTELKGIEIKIYQNGNAKWVDVTGEQIINGNQIRINYSQKIYAVRYNAYIENGFPYIVNLCNSYGMPAIAFVDYCNDPAPEYNPNDVAATATNVHVSCAFSDDMILQRDEKLSVWGTADANSGIVRVDFAGEIALANVDAQGNWKAVFTKTFAYNTEGQILKVSGATGGKTFNNVLIGDVYYLIGQSNVFYSLPELIIDLKMNGLPYNNLCDYKDTRDMRFFRISNTDYIGMTGSVAQGTDVLYTDVYHNETWMTPSDVAATVIRYQNLNPTTVYYDRTTISTNSFSALGYLFAYNMTKQSDVPVGVVEIDASGHPLITFAPGELAEKWGHDSYNPINGTHYYNLNGLVYNTDMKTRYAYNQQIYPLSNFSIAGILWYQGESDANNTREAFGSEYTNGFADQFTDLMTYFRNTFGNDDFPVYIFEFPACYNDSGTAAYMDIGGVRTELGTIPQKLEDCHIVSSSDLWYDTMWGNNIHPYIKDKNAIRLANIVLADKFGKYETYQVEGPVLREVVYEGDTKAYLYFDNVGTGLTTADGTGVVLGIEICVLYNGQFYWLPYEGQVITGKDCITVDAGSFELLAVRFNRNVEAYYPGVVNLCNSYGMPAIAFVDYHTKPGRVLSAEAAPVADIITTVDDKKKY